MEYTSGKATEHSTKRNHFVKTEFVLSAWVVITTAEADASLRPRICLPRRFCLSIGKPINPLMAIPHGPLRTASSILEIGGDLYVISTKACNVASSETGELKGEVWDLGPSKTPKYSIKECVRLGEVICGFGNSTIAIKVADTFRACREQNCRDCSMPVNTEGLKIRGNTKWGETVKVLTVGGNADQEYDTEMGHFIDLLYCPQNYGRDDFRLFTIHQGKVRTLDGIKPLPALTEVDAGSLVSQAGRYIGIVDWLWKANGRHVAEVLVFDEKFLNSLWYRLHPTTVDGRTAQRDPRFTITRAYKHLEYHAIRSILQ